MKSYKYAYPVDLVPDEGGGWIVTFPDFGYGVTHGFTVEEACAEAEDLLVELVAGCMAHDEDIPTPSGADGPVIMLDTLTSMKVELHRARRDAGVSMAEVARRLDVSRTAVSRLFDVLHNSKIKNLDAAFRCLGKRLVIEVDGVVEDGRRVA